MGSRVLVLSAVMLLSSRLHADDQVTARVRAAALVTYVHGMTDEIAAREVGPEGVPALLTLLADPSFPRRDNVVAMLGHLNATAATEPLVDYLRRPVGDPDDPANDRATLLVPRALGLIARGGDAAATAALSAIAQGGSALVGGYDAVTQDVLMAAARRGLAGVDETPSAGSSFVGPGTGPRLDAGSAPTAPEWVDDPAPRGVAARISFSNHAGDFGMTNAALKSLLEEAAVISGRADFPEDVACCCELRQSTPGSTFGQPNDGLGTVDNVNEYQRILDASGERVKVVRQINWCGSYGTNIIGCSLLGGFGMVLVRIFAPDEPLLWLHEFGHNIGLEHVSNAQYVMNEYLASTARGLQQHECAVFHNPAIPALAPKVDTGVCADTDEDGVVDRVDDCPAASDNDQSDDDGDGIGSACDNCPAVSNTTQADADQDAVGDACDLCTDVDHDDYGTGTAAGCVLHPAMPDCDDGDPAIHPRAADLCDGTDDDCNGVEDDAICSDFTLPSSDRVDGIALALVGRSFGQCSQTPESEPWAPVDYSGDQCVDGDDLAILTAVWGCAGETRICP